MDAATEQVVNSPSSGDGALTFAVSVNETFVGWGMIIVVLSVVAGLVLLTLGAVRVRRHS
jgi:hypothetical protein